MRVLAEGTGREGDGLVAAAELDIKPRQECMHVVVPIRHQLEVRLEREVLLLHRENVDFLIHGKGNIVRSLAV